MHQAFQDEEVRHKGSPSPPVPAKPNTLYSRGSFVDIVCRLYRKSRRDRDIKLNKDISLGW